MKFLAIIVTCVLAICDCRSMVLKVAANTAPKTENMLNDCRENCRGVFTALTSCVSVRFDVFCRLHVVTIFIIFYLSFSRFVK